MLQAGMVVDDTMSNLTSAISNEASISSITTRNEMGTSTNMYSQQHLHQSLQASPNNQTQQPVPKKKRNLPGNPDPEAEVVALSPRTLMATNRFVCEICNKGFQRDQNLQLHRRGHNLPWKLKQRNKQEVVRKKVYVCPEPSCVHHEPSRALGDLTGIKKHFSRKHGEKKWKCEKCSKRYAVQSDWKAHSKICGTREYRCDCGTLFSRRDSFITHRAFCDALAEESSRSMTQNPLLMSSQTAPNQAQIHGGFHHHSLLPLKQENPQNFNHHHHLPPWLSAEQPGAGGPMNPLIFTNSPRAPVLEENPNPNNNIISTTIATTSSSSLMSATALLQKAAQMGVTMSTKMPSHEPSDDQSILIRPHHHVGAPGFCATSSTTTAGLPSREEMGTAFVHGLASFGNRTAVNLPAGCMELHQDMNMVASSTTGDDGGFDVGSLGFEYSLNGILNPKSNIHSFQENAHFMSTVRKEGGGGGSGGDGLTRDFLGLRAFPHRDFLNMAGLDQMGSSSYDHHHDHGQPQNRAPWQS
ncbi:protein indeterminate-domain 7 [Sesamum alatum]|uniref:Protein indeterminate-domain 7 n=1 Tax=Sesamum alatum TaxID=300844 RepID=A0AAE2C881_9LAMI|nr:protein indeterminate-domain 7 [Sesamum alatum]